MAYTTLVSTVTGWGDVARLTRYVTWLFMLTQVSGYV